MILLARRSRHFYFLNFFFFSFFLLFFYGRFSSLFFVVFFSSLFHPDTLFLFSFSFFFKEIKRKKTNKQTKQKKNEEKWRKWRRDFLRRTATLKRSFHVFQTFQRPVLFVCLFFFLFLVRCFGSSLPFGTIVRAFLPSFTEFPLTRSTHRR